MNAQRFVVAGGDPYVSEADILEEQDWTVLRLGRCCIGPPLTAVVLWPRRI